MSDMQKSKVTVRSVTKWGKRTLARKLKEREPELYDFAAGLAKEFGPFTEISYEGKHAKAIKEEMLNEKRRQQVHLPGNTGERP